MTLSGKTALVTGASSGIGRALALALARRGSHLALADIEVGGLAETRDLVGNVSPRSTVTMHRLDVADPAAIAAMPDAIRVRHGGLDMLINNAGVALGGTFEEVDEADFDWLFAVNFFGVVRMTRAFLPMLHASGGARIVNISSLFGLIATPGQTAYTASKYAVRGFSESLRHELAGSRVCVTTVHPGGVATKIAASARAPKGAPPDEVERQKSAFAARLRLPPDRAAEIIVGAVERGKSRVIVGTDAKVAAAIERLFPVRHWEVIKRLIGRSSGERRA